MLNIVWRRAAAPAFSLHVARRHLATAFVPPRSLDTMDESDLPSQRAESERRFTPTELPTSPTFYTGRASYYDNLLELEDAVTATRTALKALQLHPLPAFARAALPPLQPLWKDKAALGVAVGSSLSTARYRRVVATLNTLNDYKRIAETAGVGPLAGHLAELLAGFEKDNKAAVLARGKRKPVEFDVYGRSYTVGRRKESSARVWVIPVQRPAVEEPADPKLDPAIQDVAPFLPIAITEPAVARREVTTTTILINNTPLHEYFPSVNDREMVIRPLKVAGLIGAFNVFAIARGGGTTGQSGAVSLGIAKALAAHVPDVELILRKAKLMRRDPRMVERKKTNLVKARKARQWVKR